MKARLQILILSLILLSQPGSTMAQNYLLKTYTVKDGLLSNEILTVNQDNYGDLWIVTQKGIIKYNGNRYTLFNTNTLKSNEVFDAWPTPDGRTYLLDFKSVMHYIYRDSVYAVTGVKGKIKGLSYYNGMLFASDLQHNTEYLALPGRYIALSDIPAYYYDKALKTSTSTGLMMYYPYVFNIMPEGIAAVHIHTRKKTFFAFSPRYQNLGFFGGKNKLFYLHHDSLLAFDPANNKTVTWYNEDSSRISYKVKQRLFSDDALQLTTANGCVTYDWNIHAVDSLRFNTREADVISMFCDQNSNYWMVTHYGLLFLNAYLRKAHRYAHIKYKKIAIMHGITYGVDNSGDIAVYNASYHKIKEINIPYASKALNLYFFKLMMHDSSLVCFTNKNISVINGNKASYLVPSPQNDRILTGATDCELHNGSLYMLNYFGVQVLNLKTGRLNTLTSERFKEITIDKSGNIFFTKNDGIYYLPNGKSGIPQKKFNLLNVPDHLRIDNDNLIITIGADIYYYNLVSQKIDHLHFNDELLYVNAGKYLWAATKNNIYRYGYINGTYKLYRQYYNFNYSIYEDINTICELDDSFAVAGNNGFVTMPYNAVLKPDSNFTNDIHVEKIKYNNKLVYIDARDTVITFPYKAKNVSFFFYVNTISYDNNVTYNYFTEGLDNQWQKTASSILTYPALPPGTYKLHLVASLDKYDLKSKEYILTINVEPMWWQRKPVIALFLLLLFSGITWLITRLSLSRKNKMLKRAILDKQMSELRLSALQSNMNPHFVFNALTSVQSFLKHNKNEAASVFITEFATLIRMYLEFSLKKLISIEDEIKALKLYTAIEQKRFDDRFNTVFEFIGIDEPGNIILPPLIIQPFVENAIVHGLYHRKGNEGLLSVTFKIENKVLFVTIDDNGIGRARSATINSGLGKAPSRGIQLVKERVDIINSEGERNISIEITDKENNAGTMVSIRITL